MHAFPGSPCRRVASGARQAKARLTESDRLHAFEAEDIRMLDRDHQPELHHRNHTVSLNAERPQAHRSAPAARMRYVSIEFLEGEPADELAAARRAQLGPVCQVAKGAETGSIVSVGSLLIGISRIDRAEVHRRIRKLNAIKHVLELDSNLERVPFFDPEVPLEVHRFCRLPLPAEESVG